MTVARSLMRSMLGGSLEDDGEEEEDEAQPMDVDSNEAPEPEPAPVLPLGETRNTNQQPNRTERYATQRKYTLSSAPNLEIQITQVLL